MAEKQIEPRDGRKLGHIARDLAKLWMKYRLKGFSNSEIAHEFIRFFGRSMLGVFTPEFLAQLPLPSHHETGPLTKEAAVETALIDLSNAGLDGAINFFKKEHPSS